MIISTRASSDVLSKQGQRVRSPRDKRRVIEAMAARGLKQLRFRFDRDGARIVANLHRS